MEMKYPAWTVVCKINSIENQGKWPGLSYEFFDTEDEAKSCHDRQKSIGHEPTMRPFYMRQDLEHMCGFTQVKLLQEDESSIVATELSHMSHSELIESINRYQHMPTCLWLAQKELAKRLGGV